MLTILQPCAASGCAVLVERGRCEVHQRETYRQQKKSSHRANDYDWQWRKLRAWHIKRFPLCINCLGDGKIVAADEVHHKIPITVDPSRRLDPTNLISLCDPCHDAEHGRQSIRTYMDDE